MDRGVPPVGERSMTTVDSVGDDDHRAVRLTEREALANVRAVPSPATFAIATLVSRCVRFAQAGVPDA